MAKSPTRISAAEREAIMSTAEFRELVEMHKVEAQRRRDDRAAQIDILNVSIDRSKLDHETFAIKTRDEIAKLNADIADDDELIAMAERTLAPRPAPVLTAHVNAVTAALEQQQEPEVHDGQQQQQP